MSEQQSEREALFSLIRGFGFTTSGQTWEIVEALMDRAALSKPSTEQGWISVNERLPKPFEDVLIYPRPTDYCCEGQVDCKGQWSYAEYVPNFGQETHRIQPTHWAPLPPPPIEPREEKL